MSKTNQNIVPHLWYDKEANEAANFMLPFSDVGKADRMANQPIMPTPHIKLTKGYHTVVTT